MKVSVDDIMRQVRDNLANEHAGESVLFLLDLAEAVQAESEILKGRDCTLEGERPFRDEFAHFTGGPAVAIPDHVAVEKSPHPYYAAYRITNKDTGQFLYVHANAKRWGILKAFQKKESGAEAFAEAITLEAAK